jgi:hypothetical protein
MSEVAGPLAQRGHRGWDKTEVDLKEIWYECVVEVRPNVNVYPGTMFGRGYEGGELYRLHKY